MSMVPQAGAVTPVAQVSVHVTVVLLDPTTVEENCKVVLVMTLEEEGEMFKMTDDVEPPPHPNAAIAKARDTIG